MHAFASRAGRWPLALTVMALGACVDRPTEPTFKAVLAPNAALGDVYTVTNTNDYGLGSLRWALSYITGGETIRFDPSLGGQTIGVDSTLNIPKSVTIEGPADAGITIDGRGRGRVLVVAFSESLTLRNLSITGGNGGIGAAGAIFGPKNLLIENSTIYGNKGGGYAAIFASRATLVNTTISGNSSTSTTQDPVVLASKIELINSTVAHNQGGGVGAGYGVGGTDSLILRNSVIANNGGRNCADVVRAFVREGANLSDDDTCGGPSDMLIADPKLGTLADNGGPTMTHALLAGSPAINAGSSCGVQADQRYAARDAQCDLGAYEFADFTAVTLTIDPTSIVKQGGWAVLTGTITCSRSESFKLALELHQEQKSGRGTKDVHAASTLPVACDTTVRPWSASMFVTDGAFQVGGATATAQTFEAEPWIAPASASAQVRLFSRK